MKVIKSIKLVFTLMLLTLGNYLYSQELKIGLSPFSGEPVGPGDRSLSFTAPLDGNQKNDVEVWVYYSKIKEQLSQNDCPRGRASCKKNSDPTSVSGTFYFPHKDHMKPNKIQDSEMNGGEPSSEEKMAEQIQNFYVMEKMPETMRETMKSQKMYSDFKAINNTDKYEISINYPSKVYYKVVRKVKGKSVESKINEFIMPRVFIIGYMGDSYAAGEGAPDVDKTSPIPCQDEISWENNICHRSDNSGGMLAIKKLKRFNRGLAIREINTTCSGAKIENLISEPQHKAALTVAGGFNSTRLAQLEEIDNWCKEKERGTIDIMLMGIGGNNIGFAPLATAAIDPTEWGGFDKAQGKAMDLLKKLPAKYDLLESALYNQEFDISKKLIFNYPNMLYGPGKKICDNNMIENAASSCRGNLLSNQLFGHINFFNEIFAELNRVLAEAAERHTWQLIKVDAINSHGLCNCDEPYFNTVGASDCLQNDKNGAVHPNADGYEELYKDKIYNALLKSSKEIQDIEIKKVKDGIKANLKEKLKKDQAKKIAKEKMKAQIREKQNNQEEDDKFLTDINNQAKNVKGNKTAVKLKTVPQPKVKSAENEKDE